LETEIHGKGDQYKGIRLAMKELNMQSKMIVVLISKRTNSKVF